MSKPYVTTNAIANQYTSSQERIIEFNNGAEGSNYKGGLISFRNLPDGTLRIEVYRVDEGVTVVTPKEREA